MRRFGAGRRFACAYVRGRDESRGSRVPGQEGGDAQGTQGKVSAGAGARGIPASSIPSPPKPPLPVFLGPLHPWETWEWPEPFGEVILAALLKFRPTEAE